MFLDEFYIDGIFDDVVVVCDFEWVYGCGKRLRIGVRLNYVYDGFYEFM